MKGYAVVCRTYVVAPFPSKAEARAFLAHIHCVQPEAAGRTCGAGWFAVNHEILPFAPTSPASLTLWRNASAGA